MKTKKVWKKYLISNVLLTIAIFTTVSILIIPQFMFRERKEQLNQAKTVIRTQCEWMDKLILESEKLLHTVSQRPDFGEICRMNSPYTNLQMDVMLNFVQDFSLFRSSQFNFEQSSIFLKNSQLFLDSGNAGLNAEVFYNSRFNQNNKPYSKWYSEILEKQNISIDTIRTAKSSRDSFILYNAKRSMFDNDIVFYAVFGNNPYNYYLQNSTLYLQSKLVVLDDTNKLMFSTETAEDNKRIKTAIKNDSDLNSITIDGKKYAIIQSSQDTLPIKYYWLILDQSLYTQAKSTLTILIATGLAMLLTFIIMAACIAYNNSKPIYSLIKRIAVCSDSSLSTVKNELDYIYNQFEKMKGRNFSLQEEMKTHFELLKTIFFTKLLNGVAISQEEIVSVSTHLGDFFLNNSYRVSLVNFEPNIINSNEVVKNIMKDVLRTAISEDFVVQTDANSFAVISSGKHSNLESWTSLLVQAIPKNEKAGFVCIVSNACNLPEQLSREYQLCHYVLDTLMAENIAYQENIVYVSDMKITYNKGYYYPLFEEQSLLNCISGKKYEEARNILKKVFNQNFISRKITLKEQNYFISHICNTFFRLLRSVDTYNKSIENYIEDVIYQIKQVQGGYSVSDQLIDIVDYLEKNDETSKENRSHVIFCEIEKMIQTNFKEESFSITEMSLKMKLSENYLSVVYHQHTGNSIAATIEKTRMEYAGTLLRDTDRYIKEVCEQSGYCNLNTFYKAFKRYYGVTPTDYRNITQKESDGQKSM